MRVMVTGATGFVGRHIVQRLVNAGHIPRCLVRSPDKARDTLAKGVELVRGDITELSPIIDAASGTDAAIHLVGIIRETPGSTFDSIHSQGTLNVVLALKEAGVKRLLHMSALGTRPGAKSRYHQTKWRAEQIVQESGLNFTIFRPSIVFGKGDGFTRTVVDLVHRAPVIPIIGSGATRYQPVYIDDLSSCFVSSLDDDRTIGQVYELCGSDTITFEQYVDMVQRALGTSKPKAHVPVPVMSVAVRAINSLLSTSPLTSDQLIMAQEDNACSVNSTTEFFGLKPTHLADVIADIV